MCILDKQINAYYIKNKTPLRIHQGDIIRDIKLENDIGKLNDSHQETLTALNFPYVLVLSQDCDLLQFFNGMKSSTDTFNQYIPNVIILPLYMKDDFKNGDNLNFLNVSQSRRSSDQMKMIDQNREPRYQHLMPSRSFALPDLYADFKVYYTMPPNELFKFYESNYVATVNVLFRESITLRFTNYLSRIGLPEIQ